MIQCTSIILNHVQYNKGLGGVTGYKNSLCWTISIFKNQISIYIETDATPKLRFSVMLEDLVSFVKSVMRHFRQYQWIPILLSNSYWATASNNSLIESSFINKYIYLGIFTRAKGNQPRIFFGTSIFMFLFSLYTFFFGIPL